MEEKQKKKSRSIGLEVSMNFDDLSADNSIKVSSVVSRHVYP